MDGKCFVEKNKKTWYFISTITLEKYQNDELIWPENINACFTEASFQLGHAECMYYWSVSGNFHSNHYFKIIILCKHENKSWFFSFYAACFFLSKQTFQVKNNIHKFPVSTPCCEHPFHLTIPATCVFCCVYVA